MSKHESWVNVEQIAEHLGVQRHSIYRWIESKGFPAHKVGRLLRFKLSEVDDWVRQGGGEQDGQSKADDGENNE